MRCFSFLFVLVAVCLAAAPASAQFSVSIADWDVRAYQQEQIDENHGILRGSVELERADTKLFADEMEYFRDKDLVIARGNVVMTQANSRIAADSAEFNTRTQLATFHHASGIAPVQQPRQSVQRGGLAIPQQTGEDNDVYFFGEVVEKLAAKKYKITKGGFTTCVQPTKRWELSANTLILNIDHYTLLRNAILSVKGVPMLYLPIMYYPVDEDGRATGFLIPTYSHDGLRGHSISNAFFWAISRSQDATLTYDYYSRTGGGGGLEYRYVRNGGFGNFTAYRLDDRATVINGATRAAEISHTVRGNALQSLPGRLMARADVNYFSSLTANQSMYSDFNQIAQNQSSIVGSVVGAWRSYSLNALFDRREFFQNITGRSTVGGNSPRVTLSRNERPLGANSRLYFSMSGEGAHIDNQERQTGEIVSDRSIGRIDFAPQIRYPFNRWQWFTVNSTASWRETYYTRSNREETAEDGTPTTVIDDENVNRSYGTFRAQAVGPVLTRVWNTPDNGYAERFKHTIEPTLTLQRTTAIENYARIVKTDAGDSQFGDTTEVTYGLNNRLAARRRTGQGQSTSAQEILSLEVYQTYYSNAEQANVDPRYPGTFATNNPSKFSAVRTSLRATPTQNVNGTLSAEIDNRSKRLKTMSANANLNVSQSVNANIGWTHRFFIAELPGYNDPNNLDNTLQGGVNLRTRNSHYGLNSNVTMDLRVSELRYMRAQGYYNAQCCGLAVEYSRATYGSTSIVPSINRFFMSFTLAGLGNFSPFSGGLNGVPRY
jgi:LPS-assembly protein